MSISKLSMENSRKFQELYLKNFSINLTEDEANLKGRQLIQLIELIHRPISNNSNSLPKK